MATTTTKALQGMPASAAARTVRTPRRTRTAVTPITTRGRAKETILTAAELSIQQAELLRQLKKEQEEIQERIDALKEDLRKQLKKGDQIRTSDGQFVISLKERSNWTYSTDLQERLIDLKADQEKEKSRGIAINNPTLYIDARGVAVK